MMNSKKAKQLRRNAYGDLSLRNAKTYMIDKGGSLRLHPSDPRATYQAMKHEKDVHGTGTEDRYTLPHVTPEAEKAVHRKFKEIFSAVFGGITGSKQEFNANQQSMVSRLSSVFRPQRVEHRRNGVR